MDTVHIHMHGCTHTHTHTHTALGKEGDHLSTPASPIGRDAMQESPSRPESEEVQPSDATGSMQRPVFQPGELYLTMLQ